MNIGTIIGAAQSVTQEGHTCICPLCQYERKNCTKACYNYSCPKCRVTLIRSKNYSGR